MARGVQQGKIGIARREAVSYTHLDVYKRQGLGTGQGVPRLNADKAHWLCRSRPDEGVGAVSYTHLDVYKRQVQPLHAL